ncbi:MAG: hypothetical protein IJM34_08115 [Lachnospiraceae bacterium]|nr:hypothetical protein [Lachnospiraceae bacterium]
MSGIESLKNVISGAVKDRFYIGIDLSDEFSQVSYSCGSEEPVTPSLGSGADRLCIPTMLAKKYGESSWSYGEEAMELSAADEAFPVDRLIERARNGRAVEVEAVDYNPVDLLALFIRKCLSRLYSQAPLEKVAAIVITVEEPDEQMIAILGRVVKTLRLKSERVFFQSHSESAYHYIMHQARDVRAADVCICDLRSTGLKLTLFSENIQTRPHVVIMQEREYVDFVPEQLEGVKNADGKKYKKDQEFYQILYGILEGRRVSAVYLLGEGFEGEWCSESLKYICKGRRAFKGNNLFSKGACYGAREKLEPSEEEKMSVFLGQDKVKANVGMSVMRGGEEAYMALLDAGRNWYDSYKDCELMLEPGDRLDFIITPLNGKNTKIVPMYLTGLPRRQRRATRIHLKLSMLSETKVNVIATDLGFGEIFAPSGLEWESSFSIL